MGRVGVKNHEKLGLKRIRCASQFNIPDTSGTNPDPACDHTDMRSSKLNEVSRTLISHIRSYPPHCSHHHPPSLYFSSTTLPSSQNTMLSHPSPSSHALIMSRHRLQAYTKYNIHPVQRTPSTASTQDCLSSLHSHDYELTPECSFSFRHASLHDPLPSASSPWELEGKVTSSHSHICKSTN